MIQAKTVDRAALQASFSRSNASYEQVTALHYKEAELLWCFIQQARGEAAVAHPRILDIGSGTGYLWQQCPLEYQQFVCLDLALGMHSFFRQKLSGNSQRWSPGLVVGVAEDLPFVVNSFDLLVSSFALQWCEELGRVFEQAKALLKKNSWFGFSLFSKGTLAELATVYREACAREERPDYFHQFVAASTVEKLLHYHKFTLVNHRQVSYKLVYQDSRELLRSLKKMGAQNANPYRPRGLGNRVFMQRLLDDYNISFSRKGRGVYASFVVNSFLVRT